MLFLSPPSPACISAPEMSLQIMPKDFQEKEIDEKNPTNYKIPYINGSLISDTNFQMYYLEQEITLSFSLHPDLKY